MSGLQGKSIDVLGADYAPPARSIRDRDPAQYDELLDALVRAQ